MPLLHALALGLQKEPDAIPPILTRQESESR